MILLLTMKDALKERAQTLRKQGKSLRTIARVLGVSSSSVSRWCRGLSLTIEQRSRLDAGQRRAALAALAPWIKKNRALKAQDLTVQESLGRKDVGKISRKELLAFGLGLYWGEGYKRGSQEWGFTNSDPAIIRTVLVWLRNCYGIKIDRISARLTLNVEHASRERSLVREWARQTRIPLSQFGPTTTIAAYNKKKLVGRTYLGTLRIKVRRGTSLRRRILASIAEVSRQIAPNSRKTPS